MIGFIVVFIVSLLFAKVLTVLLRRIKFLTKRWVIVILSILYIPLNYYVLLLSVFVIAMIFPVDINNFNGQQTAMVIIRNIMISSTICSISFYRMMRVN